MLIVFGILLTTIDVYGDIASIREMFTGGSDDCGVNDIVSFLRDADGPTWDYFAQEMKNLSGFSILPCFLHKLAGPFLIQDTFILLWILFLDW